MFATSSQGDVSMAYFHVKSASKKLQGAILEIKVGATILPHPNREMKIEGGREGGRE